MSVNTLERDVNSFRAGAVPAAAPLPPCVAGFSAVQHGQTGASGPATNAVPAPVIPPLGADQEANRPALVKAPGVLSAAVDGVVSLANYAYAKGFREAAFHSAATGFLDATPPLNRYLANLVTQERTTDNG